MVHLYGGEFYNSFMHVEMFLFSFITSFPHVFPRPFSHFVFLTIYKINILCQPILQFILNTSSSSVGLSCPRFPNTSFKGDSTQLITSLKQYFLYTYIKDILFWGNNIQTWFSQEILTFIFNRFFPLPYQILEKLWKHLFLYCHLT